MAERFSSFCNSTTCAQWGANIFKIATESLYLCLEFFIEKSVDFWILQRLRSAVCFSSKILSKKVDEYQRKVLSVPSLSFTAVYIRFFFSTFDIWISSVKLMVAEFCKNSNKNFFSEILVRIQTGIPIMKAAGFTFAINVLIFHHFIVHRNVSCILVLK